MGLFGNKEVVRSEYLDALEREYAQKYDDLFEVDTDTEEWDTCNEKLKNTCDRLYAEEERCTNQRK